MAVGLTWGLLQAGLVAVRSLPCTVSVCDDRATISHLPSHPWGLWTVGLTQGPALTAVSCPGYHWQGISLAGAEVGTVACVLPSFSTEVHFPQMKGQASMSPARALGLLRCFSTVSFMIMSSDDFLTSVLAICSPHAIQFPLSVQFCGFGTVTRAGGFCLSRRILLPVSSTCTVT